MSTAFSTSISLAARNLLRQRSRTLATLLAILLGVSSMIIAGGFVEDILIQLGEATIHSQTGHIQLAREEYWASRSRASEKHMIENPDNIKKILETQSGIDQIVSRINFVGVLNNGKRDLGIIGDGIEPDGENKIGSFMIYTEGRPLNNSDANGMVIGQGVAHALNLKKGDQITLVISMAQGAVNTMDFEIIGIFQSFSRDFDARAIRIPIKATQELLDTKFVHNLVITLEKTTDTKIKTEKINTLLKNQKIKALSWQQLSDFYEKTVKLYEAQFRVLRFIIFFMVLLSVANSINMTLHERIREFGTLMALGNHPNEILKLILIEFIALGIIGSVFGMALGFSTSQLISLIGISMPPPPNSNIGYTAQIQIDFLGIMISGFVGFFATIFAAIAPSYRITKIKIVDALRHGV